MPTPVDIFMGVMPGGWLPIYFQLALRTGNVNSYLEETSFAVMLKRGFDNNPATDNLCMAPVHLVDPFPDIGLHSLRTLHIAKSDL